MSPFDPALPDVLAALTGYDREAFVGPALLVRDDGVSCCSCASHPSAGGDAPVPWLPAATDELLRRVVEVGLAPASWGDEALAPRWVREWCGGCLLPEPRDFRCPRCDSTERGYNVFDSPSSAADIAAVLCMGADAVARVEGVARETWPTARVLWNARTAEALAHHHEIGAPSFWEKRAAAIFSAEMTQIEGVPRWPEKMPAAYAAPSTAGEWPALRKLARASVHLLESNGARCMLGVPLPCPANRS